MIVQFAPASDVDPRSRAFGLFHFRYFLSLRSEAYGRPLIYQGSNAVCQEAKISREAAEWRRLHARLQISGAFGISMRRRELADAAGLRSLIGALCFKRQKRPGGRCVLYILEDLVAGAGFEPATFRL